MSETSPFQRYIAIGILYSSEIDDVKSLQQPAPTRRLERALVSLRTNPPGIVTWQP